MSNRKQLKKMLTELGYAGSVLDKNLQAFLSLGGSGSGSGTTYTFQAPLSVDGSNKVTIDLSGYLTTTFLNTILENYTTTNLLGNEFRNAVDENASLQKSIKSVTLPSIVAGTGISVSYNDTEKTLTINAAGGDGGTTYTFNNGLEEQDGSVGLKPELVTKINNSTTELQVVELINSTIPTSSIGISYNKFCSEGDIFPLADGVVLPEGELVDFTETLFNNTNSVDVNENNFFTFHNYNPTTKSVELKEDYQDKAFTYCFIIKFNYELQSGSGANLNVNMSVNGNIVATLTKISATGDQNNQQVQYALFYTKRANDRLEPFKFGIYRYGPPTIIGKTSNLNIFVHGAMSENLPIMTVNPDIIVGDNLSYTNNTIDINSSFVAKVDDMLPKADTINFTGLIRNTIPIQANQDFNDPIFDGKVVNTLGGLSAGIQNKPVEGTALAGTFISLVDSIKRGSTNNLYGSQVYIGDQSNKARLFVRTVSDSTGLQTKNESSRTYGAWEEFLPVNLLTSSVTQAINNPGETELRNSIKLLAGSGSGSSNEVLLDFSVTSGAVFSEATKDWFLLKLTSGANSSLGDYIRLPEQADPFVIINNFDNNAKIFDYFDFDVNSGFQFVIKPSLTEEQKNKKINISLFLTLTGMTGDEFTSIVLQLVDSNNVPRHFQKYFRKTIAHNFGANPERRGFSGEVFNVTIALRDVNKLAIFVTNNGGTEVRVSDFKLKIVELA